MTFNIRGKSSPKRITIGFFFPKEILVEEIPFSHPNAGYLSKKPSFMEPFMVYLPTSSFPMEPHPFLPLLSPPKASGVSLVITA